MQLSWKMVHTKFQSMNYPYRPIEKEQTAALVSEEKTKKPRLVFFQGKHHRLPEFLQMHMRLHVQCLELNFDVVLVNWDCDYEEVCNKYEPELALFESGYKSNISQKLSVANTRSNPHVPKIGLHNGDGWCDCRSGFLSDMEMWNIETFFSISTTTAEHSPEIWNNHFTWPNFIDPAIFRDYKQPKTVPVLLTGYVNSLYPWRNKINSIIVNTYPVFSCTHPGYERKASITFQGEQYARKINSSIFVPACGTIAKEVVRKHFEIPGAGACLVTERSPALEAAGFKDMQNCVFADENDVIDKMEYLLTHRDELTAVTKAGYKLVHSQHTPAQRDYIFQWFKLNQSLRPGQKIVQKGPFGSLELVKKDSGCVNVHLFANGSHLELMRKGDHELSVANYLTAQAYFTQVSEIIPWMSEPKLKIAISLLYQGKPEPALKWVVQPLQNCLGSYGARDPDPVEWTYYIIALLCKGQLAKAFIRKNQFPKLSHPELDRIFKTISYLHYGKVIKEKAGDHIRLKSIHPVRVKSEEGWYEDLCEMLETCNQTQYASLLKRKFVLKEDFPIQEGKRVRKRSATVTLVRIRLAVLNYLNRLFNVLRIPNRRKGLPSISIDDYVVRLGKKIKSISAKDF